MPKFPFPTLLLILPAVWAAGGCAATRHETLAPIPELGGRSVVLVCDGAGNSGGLSTALKQAATERKLPLHVETCEWSYGPLRYFADQTDYAHAREQGCHLAARVHAYRQACPDSKVYLLAHSAGSAVALAAAENLPPGSVEDIVLLSPAVSADYDLRPALCATRGGIDVFTSERDTWLLGFGVAVVGTTDRRWTAAAGRVGFAPVIVNPGDAVLYQKLRQHPWEPGVAWTGNQGGHFDTYETCFLYTHVVPLLGPAEPGR